VEDIVRIDETELTYFKSSRLFLNWKQQQGCRRVHDLGVSYSKAPPPIRFGITPETQPATDEAVRISPFDIQEIPEVMRSLDMPISAKLMERWFAGALNYSPTDGDERRLINQDGKPYPPSMFDKETVTLKWVLKHQRAKWAYDLLLDRHTLRSPVALAVLKRKLAPYSNALRSFYVNDECKDDLLEMHRRFQFQYVGVESSFMQKFKQFLERQYSERGVPDDLTGALGSFNLYVAPFHISIDRNVATIDSVMVYVKDNYTFTDAPDEVSQYLGHWGPKGIVIIPYNQVLSMTNLDTNPVGEFYADSAIAVGDPRVRGSMYYPIWNKSFREWQRIHHRGGDFVILSDIKAVRLEQPIRVTLR
jgi:hypothetical protein